MAAKNRQKHPSSGIRGSKGDLLTDIGVGMDVRFPSSCGGGHGRLDRDFSSSVCHPVTQAHSTVSPSIDTAGKGKNDRWASAGLSKIAHMHESRMRRGLRLDPSSAGSFSTVSHRSSDTPSQVTSWWL